MPVTFPDAGTFNVPLTPGTFTDDDFALAIESFLAATRMLPGARAVTELTISSGSVTPDRSMHRVDTEGNAASDDLVKINNTNFNDGALLFLFPEDITRAVTLKQTNSGVGQIVLAGGVDFVMDADHKLILLRKNQNVWREIFRVTHLPRSSPIGRQVFASSGTFTIPDGVDQLHVTQLGGGGGGGGGAGSSNTDPNTGGAGGNGGSGGSSSFGPYRSVNGGSGGSGGQVNGRGGSGVSGFSNAGGDAFKGYGGRGANGIATPLNPNGRGGSGGDGGSSVASFAGGGGGASGAMGTYEFRFPINNLVPGQTVDVIVGAGGTGGSAGTGASPGVAGEAGGAGGVIVEW